MTSPPAYAIAPGSPFTAIGSRVTFHVLRNARNVLGLEGEPEDVVQHESGSLRRAESFQYHQEGHAHAVVEGDAVSRIRLLAGQLDERFGQPRADVGLVPPPRRAQLVEA
jgi:hypothetical protein